MCTKPKADPQTLSLESTTRPPPCLKTPLASPNKPKATRTPEMLPLSQPSPVEGPLRLTSQILHRPMKFRRPKFPSLAPCFLRLQDLHQPPMLVTHSVWAPRRSLTLSLSVLLALASEISGVDSVLVLLFSYLVWLWALALVKLGFFQVRTFHDGELAPRASGY